MAMTYENKEKQKPLRFGTREVVYAAIGAALYGVLAVATNFAQIPSSGDVSFRPAIAIPMFFGVAFGPIVGFLAGFVGNFLSDMISGFGFWPWWDLGNGIIGLVCGIAGIIILNNRWRFRSISAIIAAEVFVVLGIVLGMAIASLSEMWVSGVDFNTTLIQNFMPSFLSDLVFGVILVPILMVAYDAVTARSGRG